MIAQETIAEVLERASLAELVSASVTLKRRGSRYIGLCPFHQERTPSFSIRDDQFFYCFGCGASGNAIGYVMRSKGLSFVEAVEDLAGLLGVQIKRTGGRSRPAGSIDSRTLFEVNDRAAKFFREGLSRSKEAIEYLRERKVTRESVQAFSIGFAPQSRTLLLDSLRSQGVPETALISANLIKRSDDGRLFDTFRARLIFPVFVDERRVAGFGGRILPGLLEPGMSPPKYLNSAESEIYEKSKLFFGLPQAIRAIRDSGEVYIVEGYLDVVGLWQAGVKNNLATCGTAVTEKHASRLKHLARRVLFLFDGDAAGRAAAAKAFPVFLNSGLDTLAVFLPDGDDPDTFAIKHGLHTLEALRGLTSQSLFDCFLESKLERFAVKSASDLGAASKGQLCEELAQVVRRVENSVEKSEMVQRAAMKLMIEASAFERLLSEEGKRSGLDRIEVQPEESGKEPEELPNLDQEVLRAVINLKGDSATTVLAQPEVAQVLKPDTVEFLQELAEIFALSDESTQRERAKELLTRSGAGWLKFWKDSHVLRGAGDVTLSLLLQDWKKSVQRAQIAEEMSVLRHELSCAASEGEKLDVGSRILELTRVLREKGA